ncbi:hypothetical protein GCM10025857_67770 [Alicyclobacillus contaminans]|nr:hypothetical protein GCM10025857_67770 [Alicyclobacillus contaminans]
MQMMSLKSLSKEAAINGVDVFRVFDAMNDPRNLKQPSKLCWKMTVMLKALSLTPSVRFMI